MAPPCFSLPWSASSSWPFAATRPAARVSGARLGSGGSPAFKSRWTIIAGLRGHPHPFRWPSCPAASRRRSARLDRLATLTLPLETIFRAHILRASLPSFLRSLLVGTGITPESPLIGRLCPPHSTLNVADTRSPAASPLLPPYPHSCTSTSATDQSPGPIPHDFGNLRMLSRAPPRPHRISGTIPASVGYMTLLADLDLAENLISVEIPAILGPCRAVLALLDSNRSRADTQLRFSAAWGSASLNLTCRDAGDAAYVGTGSQPQPPLEAHPVRLPFAHLDAASFTNNDCSAGGRCRLQVPSMEIHPAKSTFSSATAPCSHRPSLLRRHPSYFDRVNAFIDVSANAACTKLTFRLTAGRPSSAVRSQHGIQVADAPEPTGNLYDVRRRIYEFDTILKLWCID
ncbi:hypothetical protein C4D60_Mb00t19370 [Musa balbisiana]|uniref:Uncharacterized protein n=1 Tax=Musa balbisiana TaxID=52838 RepID=A0A4S8I2A5_MUSBA|nr:hypothetical protein C4D60_Mb00t19370 [Musa balbisiana]